jgi:hypothetical protein
VLDEEDFRVLITRIEGVTREMAVGFGEVSVGKPVEAVLHGRLACLDSFLMIIGTVVTRDAVMGHGASIGSLSSDVFGFLKVKQSPLHGTLA